MVCTQLGSLCWFTGLNRSLLYNTSLILLHPAPALAKSKIISSIFILKGSDQFNQNFGPKLNGSVRSNRKSFEETGSPSTSSPGLFPKKVLGTRLVNLLRWTTFPGRTGWNFGWMDRAPWLSSDVKKSELQIPRTFKVLSPSSKRSFTNKFLCKFSTW